MKLFDKIYKSCAKLSIKPYLEVVKVVVEVYIALYALAFARYEFALVSLDNKITNLVTLSEGRNSKLALERIPAFQHKKLPVEPQINSVSSIFKSLISEYDSMSIEAGLELGFLLAQNKTHLNDLNLSGVILPGLGRYDGDINFTHSSFKDIKLIQAQMSRNIFQNSKFIKVDFMLAKMEGSDFAFSKFYNSDLFEADLHGSNLCGVEFVETHYVHVNLRKSNLIGVDLSQMFIDPRVMPNIYGAYYNSKPIGIFDNEPYKFLLENFPSCTKNTQTLLVTKFPAGFDPEKHGMIDISKL